MRSRKRIQLLLLGVLVLWTVGVGAGFARLMDYARTPGARGVAPVCWPTLGGFTTDPAKASLVLVAHPHCSCTAASVDGLEQILTRCPGRVTAHVLFYRPRGFPVNWERTALWKRATAMPGVQAGCDEDGVLAKQFGASTSGHVLLYHADGRLLFSGGITNARGHAGSSAGLEAILSLLNRGTAEQADAPVFGCPLYGPLPVAREGDEPWRK